MATIESYLHPANSGKWVNVLSDLMLQLLTFFFERLITERYKKHPWKEPIPDEYKLTDECVTKFVLSMKPVALQMMYSRAQHNDIYKIFKHLADLRPELIVPDVIDRMYATMDSLTEPHKLTASIQCLMSVSRAIVSSKRYTEGRTHVIPIFFALLPGIDPNDIRKTSVVLQCFSAFSLSIPIVNCSKAGQYYDDLTEEERLLCEQTAEFEDFVLQFLDRVFVLIDASASESTRLEQSGTDAYKSRLEILSEGLVQAASHTIFSQCSREIKMIALEKMVNFVKTHLLEPTVAAPLLGSVVRIFSRVISAEFLQRIVPYLVEQCQRYFEEHDDLPGLDKQRDELLYYLTILLNVVRGDPQEVIKYVDSVIEVVDHIFTFKCKMTNRLATQIISNLLNNLTTLQTLDIQSSPDCYTKPLSEVLPIRRWGERVKGNPNIKWYIPDENVRKVCEKILHDHLVPTIDAFEKHIRDEATMDRDDILKNLEMIMACLRCNNFLPNWDNEEAVSLCDTVVDRGLFKITLGFDHLHILMPDGRNVRLAVIDIAHRLQEKILRSSEDDIKSLRSILFIFDRVAIRRHSNSSFDYQLKTYNLSKQLQDFKLTRFKTDIRTMLATRIIMQQDCRDEYSSQWLMPSHQLVIKDMLTLSTSHYSAVRSLAQMKLANMMSNFPFSFKIIIDDLVNYLKLDSNENHEAFKGALFVLGASRRSRLIVKHSWECVEQLWIALLQSKMSEKPSVIKLLDLLSDVIQNEFPTLTTQIVISDKCVELAMEIDSSINITPQDIEAGKLKLQKLGESNVATYNRIILKIIEIVQNKQLHWRYSLMASTMIFNLVHPLTKYPAEVAFHFVNNLIHDSIMERKKAIRIINYVLRQYKRPHARLVIDPYDIAGVPRPTDRVLRPGIRDDNRWLQYELDKLPRSQEEWDQPRYIFKTNGFFGWTPTIE